jgi:hypothetical protein
MLRPVVEHDLSHTRHRRQLVAGEKMLDALDQASRFVPESVLRRTTRS